MSRFLYRSPQAVLAGLALLAGSAAAQVPPAVTPQVQGPAPLTPMVPMTPPAAAVVDPQVTTLFNQTIAAQQALTALSETIAETTTEAGTNSSQTITLAFQKPNSARVTVAGPAGPIVQLLCDGKTLTIYAVHDKKYRTEIVPPGANVIPAVLGQSQALLPRLIGQPEVLRQLLAQPGVTATLGSPGTIGGAATETINASLPTPDGSKAQFTFAVDSADHLLRSLTQTASVSKNGVAQSFTHTETVTALTVTPLSAADFTFIPPPGVTKIVPPTPKAGQAAPKEPLMHDPRLVPGARPFPLAAKDLSGKPISLAQYHGKVVLMDFWATWCGPCVGEMPNVIAAYKKYHAQGFDIVGISLDQSRPALTAFIAKNKMPWRQVFDGKGWNSAVPHQYGVTAIPFGLLIGRDGKIAALDVRGPTLTAAIKRALAK
jgi:thiol-disulfide isomerase/thioredoxin